MHLFYVFGKLVHRLESFLYPKYYTILAKIKFRIRGIKYGKGLFVDGKIILPMNKGKIVIGRNFKLVSRYKANLVGLNNPATFQIVLNGSITIGNDCRFSSPVFSSRKEIFIGNNVVMGGNVRIFDHDYHSLNYLNRRTGVNEHPYVKSLAIRISNDVFIGTNATILKGVKIGARSIIGAGSVVAKKDIEPDSIVIGNPARVLNSKSNPCNETLL